LVIVVLFGFLNIKSVKIYAIQLIFSTTLLLYKLDTLLLKESFIFRYFKVFQVSQIFTCGLSDLLLLAVGSFVVFVLREYILKVHRPI
jgi:hypothetical protein